MAVVSSRTDRGDAIVRQLMTPPYPRQLHPLYHELRSVSPVFESELGMWVLTSYDACAIAFRSPAFGQGEAAELVRGDPRFEWSAVLQTLGQRRRCSWTRPTTRGCAGSCRGPSARR